MRLAETHPSRRRGRAAPAERYEPLMRAARLPAFCLHARAARELGRALIKPRSRIGVIHRPSSERERLPFNASRLRRFDALVHRDQARAVERLARAGARRAARDLPERAVSSASGPARSALSLAPAPFAVRGCA